MRRLARHIFFFRKKKQKTRSSGRERRTDEIMAIFHLEAKVITRSVGRTACAAAAYMSCSRIYNDYDGIQHDYTRKGGLVWERVFLPPMAPAEWQDREVLWNAVEANEKTKDSQLARVFNVALPVELEESDWIKLLTEFIQDTFVSDGMCADVAIHDTGKNNPHAHILLTMRPLNQDGTWQYKTEKEYLCIRDGKERGFTAAEFKTAQAEGWEKQYLNQVGKGRLYLPPLVAKAKGFERINKYPYSTKYGRQNPITARWNSEEQLVAWRASWADHVNRSLERCGIEDRIDHRSHAERGLDEKPTIHEGPSARKMEAAGYVSERCELNRQIRADNALIRALKATIRKLKTVVETTIPAIANAMETVRQNLIIFNYGLLHVNDRRDKTGEYVSKAKIQYKDYLDLREQIKEKVQERSTCQKELDGLSVFSIGRRKELKAKVAELSELIEELRFEEKSVIQGFGKEDAAGMKQVKGEIKAAESDLVHYEKRACDLSDAIQRKKDKFTGLKEQAAELDGFEPADERLALRPKMESVAREHVRRAEPDGKIRFWNFERSIKDADRLLGEVGIAERHHREQRQKEREISYEPQHRPKEHTLDR